MFDEFFKLEKQIHDYFGYQEDWKRIPLEDFRDVYWVLYGEGPGEVMYSPNKDDLINGNEDNIYSMEIYTQRFLPKWVYRADEYTLICADPRVDMNVFLGIFDNTKELQQEDIKWSEL